MKKALVWMLAVILVMGMAVPAYAVGSPVAEESSGTATSDTVFLISTDNEKNYFELVPVDEAEKLSEDAQTDYEDAQKSLAEQAPAGMRAQYFFYVLTDKPTTAVFQIEGITELVVKQFINGEWVELEAVINGDGTVTVKGVVEGPIAFFTK